MHRIDPKILARTQLPPSSLPSAEDDAAPSMPPTSPSVTRLPIRPISKASLLSLQAPQKAVLPPTVPSLTKPRPVRPTLAQPDPRLPDATQRRPADADEETSPSTDALLIDDESQKTESSQPAPAPLLSQAPLASNEDSLLRRRSITADRLTWEAPQPAVEHGPDAPPVTPLGWRPAISRIALGWGAVSAKLGAGWDAYSRGCRRIETELSRRVVQAGAQGRKLAAISGSRLASLGRSYLADLRVARALARKAVDLAAPRVRMMSKQALSALHAGSAFVLSTPRTLVVSVVTSLDGVAKKIGDRFATGDKQPPDAGESDEVSERAARAEALKAAAKLAISSNPKRASPSSRPDVAPKPSIAPGVEKATEQPSVLSLLSRPWLAFVRSNTSPMRLTLAGLAAAFIGFLFIAFGSNPPIASAHPALTVRIPEKPYPDASRPNRHEPSVAASTADETTRSEGASVSLTISDPIADMITYLDERPLVPPFVTDLDPVLATAGGIDGLGQFVLAAERVGLGQLLEPGAGLHALHPE